jgi:hypothetical protein
VSGSDHFVMSIHTIGGFDSALHWRASATRTGFTAVRTGAAQARLLLIEARPVVQVIFAVRFGPAVALGVAAGGALTIRSLSAAAAWLLLTLVTYVANGAPMWWRTRPTARSGRLPPVA